MRNPRIGVSASSAAPGEGVLPGGWQALIALQAVTLLAFVHRQLFTLAAAPISATFDLTDTQFGVMQGFAFAMFGLAAAYPIAWLADRHDRRAVLALCVTILSVGAAGCALAQTYAQLFAAAALIAAGETGCMPIALAVIPDFFHGGKRILANGINYFAGLAGIALAFAAGAGSFAALDMVHDSLPRVLRTVEPWRLAFLSTLLPVPGVFALIGFSRIGMAAHVDGEPQLESESRAGLWPHIAANRQAIGPLMCAIGTCLLVFSAFLAWLPAAATRAFGSTPAENGAGLVLASGIGMAGGAVTGGVLARFLSARHGRRGIVRAAWFVALATLPVLFLMPVARTAADLFAGFAVVAFGGTAIGVLAPAMLQDLAPAPLRARLMAVYTTMAALLSGVAPALVGSLSDWIGGDRNLIQALSAVALPAWLAMLVLFRAAEIPFVRLRGGAA